AVELGGRRWAEPLSHRRGRHRIRADRRDCLRSRDGPGRSLPEVPAGPSLRARAAWRRHELSDGRLRTASPVERLLDAATNAAKESLSASSVAGRPAVTSTGTQLDLTDADVTFFPHFFSVEESDRLLDEVNRATNWRQETVDMDGA